MSGWGGSSGFGGGGAVAGFPTLAQVLAVGADGNGVSQTNLGNLALAAGKGITNALHVVSVRATSGQVITDGAAPAPIVFHVEDVDTAGVCPVGAGASSIVVVTGGAGEVYECYGQLAIASSMVAQASMSIRLVDPDGSTIIRRITDYGTSNTWFYRALSGTLVSTAAGQTIRLYLGHTSGADRTTDPASVDGDVSCLIKRWR